MNSFATAMNTYQEMSIWLKPSTDCIKRIKDMQERPVKVGIGNRIVIFYIFLITILLCVIPATVYATTYISKELYGKLKDAGLSQDEMGGIQEKLQGWGFSSENISELEQLLKNDERLTYGPDAFGADLIAVISDQGERGYIYRSDYEAVDTKPLDNMAESREEGKVLKVYQSDGRTVIGTFTLNDGKQGD